MSASGGDDSLWEMARNMGPTEAVRAGISRTILGFFAGISLLMGTLFDSLGEVVKALGAVRDVAVAMIGTGPVMIILEGAGITASELEAFGITAFGVGIASVALGWVVWNLIDPEVPLLNRLLPWR